MHEHPDTEILIPPGTYLENLPHPDGSPSKRIELAIFKEHRFSFYFWNRWLRASGTSMGQNDNPPALVTIDWHRDLAPPTDEEKKQLEALNISDQEEVAKFVWSQLDTHNDSHLLSAAYLNLIGDIYLLKNYGDDQENSFEDCHSNIHRVFEYHSYDHFEEAVTGSNFNTTFLDIDLDFFIKGKVASHQLEEVTIFSDNEIAALTDNSSPLFKHLFSKLEGITIASEPRYCGGILKSHHILDIVLKSFFTSELQWKHLKQ